jgi:hypothetical protein
MTASSPTLVHAKKRKQRSFEEQWQENSLGVNEFILALREGCTTSHDTNDCIQRALQLHKVLQKFIRLVRLEKEYALFSYVGKKFVFDEAKKQEDNLSNESKVELEEINIDENNEDGEFDDDETSFGSTVSQARPKKRKIKEGEEWMQDIAGYNVPFVGTSINRGSTGELLKGQWPTGFLAAYLRTSPTAAELVTGVSSDQYIQLDSPASIKGLCQLILPIHQRSPSSSVAGERHLYYRLRLVKKEKLMEHVYARYLQALKELLTAAIPPRRILWFDNKAITNIDVAYFRNLCENDCSESGREWSNRFVDKLVQHRLSDFLIGLRESTNNGKGKPNMVNSCGPNTPDILGILTCLALTSADSSTSGTTYPALLLAGALRKEMPEAVIRFLLKQPSIARPPTSAPQTFSSKSYVSDSTNVKANIATIRLATALLINGNRAVLSSITAFGDKERKLSPGILCIIFWDGIMAPSLTVDGSSESTLINYFSAVADLFNVVLVTLLMPGSEETTEQKRQDFFSLFNQNVLHIICQYAKFAPDLGANRCTFPHVLDAADQYESTLSPLQCAGIGARRILFRLVSDHSSSPLADKDENEKVEKHSVDIATVMASMLICLREMETQRFLKHCLMKSPTLIGPFLQSVSLPDVSNGFTMLSTLNFVTRLLQLAPPVLNCTRGSPNQKGTAEVLMSLTFPYKFRRHILIKLLQSQNALIVTTILKLIAASLSRFTSIVSDQLNPLSNDRSEIQKEYRKWLPEPQILLAIATSFQVSLNESKTVVVHHICKVVERFICVLPELFQDAAFDCSKLIPENELIFCNLPIYVQHALLRCLHKVMQVNMVSEILLSHL